VFQVHGEKDRFMEVVIKGLVPLSYNSRNKAVYQKMIRDAFQRRYHGAVPCFPATDELYARVYFFTNDGVNVDADNISKPIWDAVNGIAYVDDRKIVMRTAAVIDVNVHPFNTIDTSGMSGAVAADLMQSLTETSVKCLYIECGKFKESMIKIGEEI